jgi:hypothetical protein
LLFLVVFSAFSVATVVMLLVLDIATVRYLAQEKG